MKSRIRKGADDDLVPRRHDFFLQYRYIGYIGIYRGLPAKPYGSRAKGTSWYSKDTKWYLEDTKWYLADTKWYLEDTTVLRRHESVLKRHEMPFFDVRSSEIPIFPREKRLTIRVARYLEDTEWYLEDTNRVLHQTPPPMMSKKRIIRHPVPRRHEAMVKHRWLDDVVCRNRRRRMHPGKEPAIG